MPPKADKKEKQVKGDEAEELVLQYLKSVNRPYASTDVSNNLKGKVPKPAAQKILNTLAEKGSLTMKPYGKQTIFVYNQANLEVLNSSEMSTLNDQMKEAQGTLEAKRKELKALQNELSAKQSNPMTKDLAREIERIKSENALTLKALGTYRGESKAAPPLSKEEAQRIDADWDKWRREWVSRRKVYKELLDILGEGGAYANREEFEEQLGVEQDDDDAVEVEKGEFCMIFSGPRRTTKPTAPGAGSKRPATQNSLEDGAKGKKKKDTK